ncbi:MAG: molybdopterin molybdotransferase MoeA [Saccharospirillaceae bacterium]|nr:molybdopterin molybdotransferase MoeA [Pseudomonadales bacterium]NRB80549.1 molybdopterin molybdotransferase MoeA [Saccharospirillaceae bacterium]
MISCDTQSGLLDVEDALKNMRSIVKINLESQNIHIRTAKNRVLAKPVKSTIAVPNFDNSAMDGYAFFVQSTIVENTQFEVIGQALAGHPFNTELKVNQCIKIMTGAKIPNGANSVCMQENVLFEDNKITLQTPCKHLQNIRKKGEDIQVDDVLFEKGHRLTSCDLSVLASIGNSTVEVFEPITVALFSTGDELLDVDTQSISDLKGSQIFESNSFVLQSMLESFGVKVINFGHIKDEEVAIEQAFLKAAEQADAIITTGGVSVGQADLTRKVLNKIAQMHFWKLAIKPGKPFTFGHLNQTQPIWIFALPGNPVSATVTMHQLVLPILKQAQFEQDKSCIHPAITTSKIKKRAGRKDYQRGHAYNKDGQLMVDVISGQGSGLMYGLSKANCFVVLDKDQSDIDIYQSVNILWFDEYL